VTTALYILIAIAAIQGIAALRGGAANLRYARSYRTPASPPEPVIVFCPVRGADPELSANAGSLLGQDYPDYRVVFLVDEATDPALLVLAGMGCRVEISGRAAGRSRKVHSLLHGIARFGGEASIWVFADADARFPAGWLRELVAPLGTPEVGATTGYRWYVPEGDGPTLLRSAWNASIAGLLGPGGRNFAWGGSTAIRGDVFARAGIAALWEGALSDDYALARGVRASGLRLVFVPTCLVPSYGACTWRALFEFTTRQIRITRVYEPQMWWVGLLSFTLFNLAFAWTTLGLLSGSLPLAAPWVLLYGLSVFRSHQRLGAAARAITHPSLGRHRWFYLLSPPLISLLFQVNFLVSAASRRIVWKGVTYVMISPSRTLVRDGEPFLPSPARENDGPPEPDGG
jgi:GT2 family glycosyltransferase